MRFYRVRFKKKYHWKRATCGGWVLSNHPPLLQLIRDRSELINSLISVSPLVDSSESKKKNSAAEDPVANMEEGTGNESDTTAHMLMEGLKKQRRSSQGYPEYAIVDSDDEDVVEQEDYLKGKMKTQRSLSQGYALGTESSDEESCMVEIDLN